MGRNTEGERERAVVTLILVFFVGDLEVFVAGFLPILLPTLLLFILDVGAVLFFGILRFLNIPLVGLLRCLDGG